LLSSAGGSFLDNSYDLSGNLKSQTRSNGSTVSLDGDPDDMIRRIRNGSRGERYFYDQNDQRFLAVNDDGSWRFYLGSEYEIDVSGSRIEMNVYVFRFAPDAGLGAPQ
jgi:YD repeat-containing protein